MADVVRRYAVLSAIGGVALVTGLQVTAVRAFDAPSSSGGVDAPLVADLQVTQLKRLDATLYHVEERYVAPARIDWEAMFVAGLEGVEARVPVLSFDREGDTLNVVADRQVHTLTVPVVRSRAQLQRELARVMAVVERDLDPSAIPMGNASSDDPRAELEYALVNGVLSTLDPHTILVPPEDARQMDSDNKGQFGGLGVTVSDDQGQLVVEYTLKGSPAAKAGLRPGDVILRVDGESTINMTLDELVERLRGELDEAITLVVRHEQGTEPVSVQMRRQAIKVNEVRGDLLDGRVGYVRIESFHMQVESDLHALLARLRREAGGELRGLVLDLRGNPGGYLTQAVAVADTFLSSGTIVSTVDRVGRTVDKEEATARQTEPNYPLVLLVDAHSASASEVVAGALRNNERAVIVGERSFGKGSVQNLHPYADGSKLKITISRYLTPGERSIQSVGIPADVALLPVVAQPGLAEGDGPLVRVYWRELVKREADLDQHLDETEGWGEKPSYELAYRHDVKRGGHGGELDLADFQVQLARDLVLASPSGRRGEVLASAGRLLMELKRRGERDVVAGMAGLGVDWSAGPASAPGETPQVQVKVKLGRDGVLHAGEPDTLVMEVKNLTSHPLYRVGALVTGSDLLGGGELVFGKLAPGETRSWTLPVDVVEGWPTETVGVPVSVRDIGGEIAKVEPLVRVEGRALPRLAWTWEASDKPYGNGNGLIEPGERVVVDLKVENVGEGRTMEAYARLRNRSGKAVELIGGTSTLELGPMRDAAGAACAPLSQGLEGGFVLGGDPDADLALADAAVFDEQCKRWLAPGERWEGRFVADLGLPDEGAWHLELELGDGRAFDVAGVYRTGLWQHESWTEKLDFSVASAPGGPVRREPPRIAVISAPDSHTSAGPSVLKGVASDDQELSHVLVYVDGDKRLITQGGRGDVPFSVPLELEPGEHTVTLLAIDQEGLSTMRSVVTWAEALELQARAP